MEIKEFAVKVRNAIEKRIGEGYTVRLQEVQKNNGIILQGLLILAEEKNISPTIYLNSFWEAYENGIPFALIVERIMQIYEEDTPKESIDMSFFKEFDKVKERICFRLISAAQNEELLAQIPHVAYLDMAICFYYAYYSEILGNGSILIYNNHLDMWHTTTEELLALARHNTPKLFPLETNSMEETIREMLSRQEEAECELLLEEYHEFFRTVPMQVVSNTSRVHGAACILYPDMLKAMAEGLQRNLYVIPSSIHEIIVLPDSGREDTGRLREIISEVNCTQVEPEEILSDNLYYYDRLLEQLRII